LVFNVPGMLGKMPHVPTMRRNPKKRVPTYNEAHRSRHARPLRHENSTTIIRLRDLSNPASRIAKVYDSHAVLNLLVPEVAQST
jgi:hypothetical protein